MALQGTETLQVQGVAANGMPSGQTLTVTTAQIAALAGDRIPVVASSMEYSPEMLYAATGTSTASRTRRTTSR